MGSSVPWRPRLRILLIVFLSVSIGSLLAWKLMPEKASVIVQVLDSTTLMPLPDATVYTINDTGQVRTTDITGKALFRGLSPGSYVFYTVAKDHLLTNIRTPIQPGPTRIVIISPSINRVVTPSATGPCTWFVSLNGTTPVAKAMVGGLSVSPGDNVVGTAGGDPGAFLNSLSPATGQEWCFSSQTFTFTSTFTIPSDKPITLQGSATLGQSGTTFVNNQNNALIVISAAYSQVRGINFQGTNNAANTADVGIEINGVNNIVLDNDFFLSSYNDVLLSGTIFYTTIAHCQWYSATNDLVFADSSANLNIHFTDDWGLVNSAVNGFELQGLNGLTLTNVEMSGTFTGTVLILDRFIGGSQLIANSVFENTVNSNRAVWVKGSAGTPVKFVYFTSIFFGGGQSTGSISTVEIDYGKEIFIQGAEMTGLWRSLGLNNVVQDLRVQNVRFDGGSSGIWVANAATIQDLTVIGNRYPTAGDYLVNFGNIPASQITGNNVFEDNDVTGSNGFSMPATSNTVIANNPGYNPQPNRSVTAGTSPWTFFSLLKVLTVLTILTLATMSAGAASVPAARKSYHHKSGRKNLLEDRRWNGIQSVIPRAEC